MKTIKISETLLKKSLARRERRRDFFIVESKYSGTSKLKNTLDGPQMGDVWIKNRLEKALYEDDFIKITGKQYKRILSEVKPDGSITYKLLKSQDGKIFEILNM